MRTIMVSSVVANNGSYRGCSNRQSLSGGLPDQELSADNMMQNRENGAPILQLRAPMKWLSTGLGEGPETVFDTPLHQFHPSRNVYLECPVLRNLTILVARIR